MQEYARFAVKTRGWRDYSITNLNYFDDTDGSGLHPNQPGVEADIQVTAPSGLVYEGKFILNESAHNLDGSSEHDDDIFL